MGTHIRAYHLPLNSQNMFCCGGSSPISLPQLFNSVDLILVALPWKIVALFQQNDGEIHGCPGPGMPPMIVLTVCAGRTHVIGFVEAQRTSLTCPANVHFVVHAYYDVVERHFPSAGFTRSALLQQVDSKQNPLNCYVCTAQISAFLVQQASTCAKGINRKRLILQHLFHL